IRFNVNDYTAVRFSSGDYSSVAIGGDGLLYASGGLDINVFDPTTLAFVRHISPAVVVLSLAVAQNGHIFAGNYYNHAQLAELDANGALLRTFTPGVSGFSGLSMDSTGRIATYDNAKLLVTDTSLSSFSTFDAPGGAAGTAFVAWNELPLGSTTAPLTNGV